jgi:hypothetical protein
MVSGKRQESVSMVSVKRQESVRKASGKRQGSVRGVSEKAKFVFKYCNPACVFSTFGPFLGAKFGFTAI